MTLLRTASRRLAFFAVIGLGATLGCVRVERPSPVREPSAARVTEGPVESHAQRRCVAPQRPQLRVTVTPADSHVLRCGLRVQLRQVADMPAYYKFAQGVKRGSTEWTVARPFSDRGGVVSVFARMPGVSVETWLASEWFTRGAESVALDVARLDWAAIRVPLTGTQPQDVDGIVAWEDEQGETGIASAQLEWVGSTPFATFVFAAVHVPTRAVLSTLDVDAGPVQLALRNQPVVVSPGRVTVFDPWAARGSADLHVLGVGIWAGRDLRMRMLSSLHEHVTPADGSGAHVPSDREFGGVHRQRQVAAGSWRVDCVTRGDYFYVIEVPLLGSAGEVHHVHAVEEIVRVVDRGHLVRPVDLWHWRRVDVDTGPHGGWLTVARANGEKWLPRSWVEGPAAVFVDGPGPFVWSFEPVPGGAARALRAAVPTRTLQLDLSEAAK